MARTDASTLKFDDGIFLPPVERADDLYALAPDGQLCFVKSEGEVYERRDGEWVTTGRGMPGSPPSGEPGD